MQRGIDLVKVVRLGRLPYNPSLLIQKWFQDQHVQESGSSEQVLVLVEHEPGKWHINVNTKYKVCIWRKPKTVGKFCNHMIFKITFFTVYVCIKISNQKKTFCFWSKEHLFFISVYTLGLREKLDAEQVETLTDLGAQVIKSDRGGLTTFHGPGQLVAYPIFHLNRLSSRLSLRNYVSLLEGVGVHTCRMLGVPADVSNLDVSHTGAWVGDKKICAIGKLSKLLLKHCILIGFHNWKLLIFQHNNCLGVHCKRHVTTHGLALNCNVDLSWYDHITPCGIIGKGVTSLSNELHTNISVESVESQFLASFQCIFKFALQDYNDSAFSQFLDDLHRSEIG